MDITQITINDPRLIGELEINVGQGRLSVRFNGGDGVGIRLPRHIRVEELGQHELLSWAVLAGTQLATKLLDRDLPPDVAEALARVARYAYEDS